MKTKITEQAYSKAIEVLKACEKPKGFFASGLKGGYEATWARDSMITSLGASLAGDQFKKTIKNSLELLSNNQSLNGLIPNCVGSFNEDRQSEVTFNSIDAPQWYIIGHYIYAHAFADLSLIEKYKNNIARALVWLRYQDPNEDKLLVQQPTMDWMDAFPHKYGRVMHTQSLYYGLLNMVGNHKLAEYIKEIINGETQGYLSLYEPGLGYYLPWAWKNHDGDREQEEWFDSLANLLAIITGLATKKIADSILDHIEKAKVNRPYPCKAIWPPIKEGDKGWHSYFSKCDARDPFRYLNGGIWPFIGGFYIVALIKAGRLKKAEKELEMLAKANLSTMPIRKLKGEYGFNEWLDGADGMPSGEPFQAWSAGTYIYAYECLKQKKVIFF
jgi:GH15 family glucan-1,4-alpha-glucosidase